MVAQENGEKVLAKREASQIPAIGPDHEIAELSLGINP
jgi:hypothetical protein